MTLVTTAFDVKASMLKKIKLIVAEIQSEINLLSLALPSAIEFASQRQPKTDNCARVWWFTDSGIENRKSVDRFSIDLFTTFDPENPDDMFPSLIKTNLLRKLGLLPTRTAPVAWFYPDGTLFSGTYPTPDRRRYKLELSSIDGFRNVPEPEETTRHDVADFKVTHY